MIDIEGKIAIGVIVFLCIIIEKIFYSCFVEPTAVYLRERYKDFLARRETKRAIKDSECDDKFLKLVEDFLYGRIRPVYHETNSNVEVLTECTEPLSCPCAPQNADCCNGFEKDGKFFCPQVIDLNKLCRVDEEGNDVPSPLTPEEVEILANALTQLWKSQEEMKVH